ncbi:hypothetical protein BH11MYX1_BH11MYX1_12200 [soil metagenome]
MTLREDLEKLTVGANPNPLAAVTLADAHYALANNFRYVMDVAVPEPERAALRDFAFEALRAWLPSIDQAAIDQLRPRFEGRGTPLDLDARTRALVAANQREYDAWLDHHAEVVPAELAAVIDRDPDDLAAYRILGDAMIDRGYARGELIAAQLADPKLEGDLGPLVPYTVEPWQCTFTWRAGFLRSAALGIVDPSDYAAAGRVNELLDLLLRHPAARFLVELSIGIIGYVGEADDLGEIARTIGRAAPPTLRSLELGAFSFPRDADISAYKVGDVSAALVPQLRSLIVQGADIELGSIDLPRLEHLEIKTGGLRAGAARSIAAAKLPKIEDLELWFGSPDYGNTTSLADLRSLFDRSIASVALRNCPEADELCKRLLGTSLLAGARRLDLSLGTMTDLGARTIADHRGQFAHLAELDLSDNYISAASLAALQGLNVTATDQREEHEDHRYVSVGE